MPLGKGSRYSRAYNSLLKLLATPLLLDIIALTAKKDMLTVYGFLLATTWNLCMYSMGKFIYSNIITASYIHERRVIAYICTNGWVVSIICRNFTSFLFGKNDIEIFKILSSHLWCVSSNIISSDNEAVGT